MKKFIPVAIAVLLGLGTFSILRAEEHGGRNMHLPPRAAPPHFVPHPRGAHPSGGGFHQHIHPHPVRVLAPKPLAWGGPRPWGHWEHPEFVRPMYYWNWASVQSVTCISEDSYGDQYPVSMSTFAGFGLVNMTAVEDDALDRCYSESGSDPSCYLLSCSHF